MRALSLAFGRGSRGLTCGTHLGTCLLAGRALLEGPPGCRQPLGRDDPGGAGGLFLHRRAVSGWVTGPRAGFAKVVVFRGQAHNARGGG